MLDTQVHNACEFLGISSTGNQVKNTQKLPFLYFLINDFPRSWRTWEVYFKNSKSTRYFLWKGQHTVFDSFMKNFDHTVLHILDNTPTKHYCRWMCLQTRVEDPEKNSKFLA